MNFLNKARVGKDHNGWPHGKVQQGDENQWEASLGQEVSKARVRRLGFIKENKPLAVLGWVKSVAEEDL